MENEKEIQGQEINESPETQEETVVEAKTENQTSQEEPWRRNNLRTSDCRRGSF